jgi:hypothetical protein
MQRRDGACWSQPRVQLVQALAGRRERRRLHAVAQLRNEIEQVPLSHAAADA